MRWLEAGKEGILGRNHVERDVGQDHGGLVPGAINDSVELVPIQGMLVMATQA